LAVRLSFLWHYADTVDRIQGVVYWAVMDGTDGGENVIKDRCSGRLLSFSRQNVYGDPVHWQYQRRACDHPAFFPEISPQFFMLMTLVRILVLALTDRIDGRHLAAYVSHSARADVLLICSNGFSPKFTVLLRYFAGFTLHYSSKASSKWDRPHQTTLFLGCVR